jgi:hypothetical protein
MMSRWITLSEIRLGLRLIAKQPILSITVVLALAYRHRPGDRRLHPSRGNAL